MGVADNYLQQLLQKFNIYHQNQVKQTFQCQYCLATCDEITDITGIGFYLYPSIVSIAALVANPSIKDGGCMFCNYRQAGDLFNCINA